MNKRYTERAEARQELRRFEERAPELLRLITPEAATLVWLMLGNKMWAKPALLATEPKEGESNG